METAGQEPKEGTVGTTEKVADALHDAGKLIYIILSTLADHPRGEAPESFVYLPMNQSLDMHLDQFYRLVEMAITVGWLERNAGPVLRITEDGRTLVNEIEAIKPKVQP